MCLHCTYGTPVFNVLSLRAVSQHAQHDTRFVHAFSSQRPFWRILILLHSLFSSISENSFKERKALGPHFEYWPQPYSSSISEQGYIDKRLYYIRYYKRKRNYHILAWFHFRHRAQKMITFVRYLYMIQKLPARCRASRSEEKKGTNLRGK